MDVDSTSSKGTTVKRPAVAFYLLTSVLLVIVTAVAAWHVGFHGPSRYLDWTVRAWLTWAAWLLMGAAIAWLSSVRSGRNWSLVAAAVTLALAYRALSTWKPLAMKGFAARVVLVNSCVDLVAEATRVSQSKDVEPDALSTSDVVVSNAFSVVFGCPVQWVAIRPREDPIKVFSYKKAQCELWLLVGRTHTQVEHTNATASSSILINLGLPSGARPIEDFVP